MSRAGTSRSSTSASRRYRGAFLVPVTDPVDGLPIRMEIQMIDPSGLVVLALDAADAEDWKQEHPELADSARIVVADGRGWDALDGIWPTSLSLGYAAAGDANIAGTHKPVLIALALAYGEVDRPAYLRGAA